MNYEEKTDLEIENLVSAEKWKERCLSKKQWNNTAQRTYKEIQEGVCVYADARYCSNPSDAWKLMVSNGISLITLGDEWEAHHLDEIGEESNNVVQASPGRAVSICFLKMKESENG